MTITQNKILFWIAVLGFFGVTGANIMNWISQTLTTYGNVITFLIVAYVAKQNLK